MAASCQRLLDFGISLYMPAHSRAGPIHCGFCVMGLLTRDHRFYILAVIDYSSQKAGCLPRLPGKGIGAGTRDPCPFINAKT